MRIQPQGAGDAFDGLQRPAFHDEQIRSQRIGVRVVRIQPKRRLDVRR